MLHAVIMAGGSGTRFWPASRGRLPKQFLKLFGPRSLLQQAFDRVAGLVGPERTLVITNEIQVLPTAEQLPEVAATNIIGEPCGRDTAACIGLAAALLARQDANARMIVLAADHLISPTEAFHDAVRAAEEVLDFEPDGLVTFGIPPNRPATGYGYLKRGSALPSVKRATAFRLDSFHEKPNLETAMRFVAGGEHFWNSGIFCWRAATILEQLQTNAPAIAAAVSRIAAVWDNGPNGQRVFRDEYDQLPRISIDHAVMEKAPKVFMVEPAFAWDDVGSWLALERTISSTEGGNTVIGEHHGERTAGCIVVGQEHHLVATLGVRDLIIVHTDDVTLIAHRDEEQNIKQLLDRLKDAGLDRHL